MPHAFRPAARRFGSEAPFSAREMKHRTTACSRFESTLILEMDAFLPGRGEGDDSLAKTAIPPRMHVEISETPDATFHALLDRNIAREPARPDELLDLAGF